MAITERLALLITADPRDAVRGLQGLERQADRSLTTATDKIDRLGSRFTQVGTVMLTAGGIAAAGLVNAGMAAAELEQAVGGTEAVFGELSGKIDEFAQDAAQAMGLSEQEFRLATTSIGGNLKRMGLDLDEATDQSIVLTQVAADLAATYGGTTAEAVAALGAAFRGEADPAERFNLNLKASAVNARAVELGLAANTTEVSENAKAQALLSLIMEQSADAQGQFARETDTASGQMAIARAEMENFKAAIGQAVAPILADTAGLVAGLAESFNRLPQPVRETISQLTVAATAASLVGGGSLIAVGQVIKFRDTLKTLAQQAPRTASALSALGKGGLVVGGMFALAAAADAVNDSLEGVGKTIEDVAAATDEALMGMVDGAIWAAMQFGNSAEDVLEGIAEHGDLGIGVLARYRDGLVAMGRDTKELDKFLQDHATDQATVNDVTDRGADVMADLGGETRNTTRATERSTEAIKERQRAIEEMIDAMRDSISNDIDLAQALLDSAEEFENYQSVLADTEASERDRQRAGLELIETYLAQGEAAFQRAEDEAIAAGDAENATRIATEAQIASLLGVAQTLEPGSHLRQMLDEYIWVLTNAIPRNIETTLTIREVIESATRQDDARARNLAGISLSQGNHLGPVTKSAPVVAVWGDPTPMALARMEGIASSVVEGQRTEWNVN